MTQGAAVHVLHMSVSSSLSDVTVLVEVQGQVEAMRVALPALWQQRHAIQV